MGVPKIQDAHCSWYMSKKNCKKRGVSYSYRTATTSYLCYVPVLED